MPLAQAAPPLQAPSEQFFQLTLDGTIEIENSGGSIHLFGWYQPQVRVATVRKAYSAARLKEIRVESKAEAASLKLRTVIPEAHGLFADRSGTVDYTVNVPERARLKLKMGDGEITLQGLRGAEVEVELQNGRITALNCFAKIRARAPHGVMEAFFEWWENLPATFDYVLGRGRIGVRLPEGAHFEVVAQTGNGRIHQEFHLPDPTDRGAGQVLKARTKGDPTISLGLRTGGGNISLDRSR